MKYSMEEIENDIKSIEIKFQTKIYKYNSLEDFLYEEFILDISHNSIDVSLSYGHKLKWKFKSLDELIHYINITEELHFADFHTINDDIIINILYHNVTDINQLVFYSYIVNLNDIKLHWKMYSYMKNNSCKAFDNELKHLIKVNKRNYIIDEILSI